MKKGDGRSKAARLVKLVVKDEAKKVIYDWGKQPAICTTKPKSRFYFGEVMQGWHLYGVMYKQQWFLGFTRVEK